MWTGTFVLAAAGISLMLLSLFHLAVDAWNGGKWAKWAFPLRVIGVNALAAYLIHALLNVHELNQRIFSGAADFFPPFQPVLLAVPFSCCNGWFCSFLQAPRILRQKPGQVTAWMKILAMRPALSGRHPVMNTPIRRTGQPLKTVAMTG